MKNARLFLAEKQNAVHHREIQNTHASVGDEDRILAVEYCVANPEQVDRPKQRPGCYGEPDRASISEERIYLRQKRERSDNADHIHEVVEIPLELIRMWIFFEIFIQALS